MALIENNTALNENEALEPRFGAIAYCSRGCLGIITSHDMRSIVYNNGHTGNAWTGFHLDPNNPMGTLVGSLWSSSKPRVIGYVTEEIMNEYRSKIHEGSR